MHARTAFPHALLAAALAFAPAATMADTNNWLLGPTDGDWTATDRWSLGDYPGNVGRTDDDVVFSNSSTGGTITLDETMFPSGLTLRTMTAGLTNSGSAATTLAASGTSENRLSITVGENGIDKNWVISLGNRFKTNLTNVDLLLTGTPSYTGTGNSGMIYLNGNDKTPATPSLVAVDSTISILAAPANPNLGNNINLGLWLGGNDRTGANAEMTRGALTVTNATNDGAITIGAQGQLKENQTPSWLKLTDTVLSTNILNVQHGGTFLFDGTNAVSASTITNRVRFGSVAGSATISGGELNIASIVWDVNPTAGLTHDFNITGGTVNLANAVTLSRTGSQINVSAGSLTAAALVIETGLGTHDEAPDDGLNITGSGAVQVTGLLRLGRHANGNHQAGVLTMTAGTLDANQLDLGAQNGDGHYRQSGGDATVGLLRFGLTGPDGRTWGAREFNVGSGATLSLTGEGMGLFEHAGVGGREFVIATSDWNADGAIVFAPGAGVTQQTLLAFGQDLGDDTAGYTENYAISALDVSALTAAGALLNVIAADDTAISNLTGPNAIYVGSLTLGAAGQLDPGSFFAGNANIYYDPTQSDITGTHAFTGGGTGSLIALTIPEPASALLLTVGALVMLRRRKSAV